MDPIVCLLEQPILQIPMVATVPSGATGDLAVRATWMVGGGDLFLVVALCFLFLELLKSTNSGRSTIINHALSLLVFVVCLVEFLLFGAFATSEFFLLTLMALLDVLAGFIVTIATSRRDVSWR